MDLEHILTDQPVDVDTKIAFLQNLKLVKLKLCEKFLILDIDTHRSICFVQTRIRLVSKWAFTNFDRQIHVNSSLGNHWAQNFYS